MSLKVKCHFKNVYFTGLIRDKQRRKMSKSLGNSPDALELIEKFGADSVRMGSVACVRLLETIFCSMKRKLNKAGISATRFGMPSD
jgi:valyl-tRNA synthetase